MELMLTVLIAATLMGVAVPAFRGMINSNRVLTQSNDIVAALNLARSEAITRTSLDAIPLDIASESGHRR